MKKKKSKLKISMFIATIVLLFVMILSCCLKCKVTFVTDGNEIYKTIVVNRGETIKEPDHPEKEGHTFCGWYVEDKKYDFSNPIKESVKLEASWCVNEYEVTIKTGTGSIINNKIKYNENISLPNKLTKTGYNFLGWFSNGDKVDSNTKVTSDMTVEGIWAKKDYTIYTVEHYYMDRDGNYPSIGEKEIFTAKTDSVVTPSVKNKKGYTSPKAESIKVLCDGKNVIKYYYPINSYNLTVQGDIGISDTTGDGTYFYGDKVEILYTLKPGYSFVSYSENIEDNFYIVGEEDVIIYITTEANTNTKYTVEHYQMDLLGKYSNVPTSFDILEGTTDTKITPKVNVYEGFTSPKSEEVIIKGDESTVVKYYYERNKYELHVVESTGIEKVYGNGTYYYGDKVTVKADVKTGYTFDKWSNGNTNVTFEHTIGAQNKAIIARATVNVYDITYKLNNGIATNPASYTVEDEIELSIPERLGYTFVKWEGNNISSDGKIAKGTTGNISVEAIWKTNNYQIQYNLNGSTLDNKPNSYTVEDEIELSIPKKIGYTFVKWEGNKISSDGKIKKGTTGDISVEAIFVPNKYSVIFNSNGATSGEMSSQEFIYDKGTSLIENKYLKTGYTFAGWNTASNGSGNNYENQESVSNLATSGTITLYAMWTANTYEIEYNSNLGTGTMPIQLTKYDLETILYENVFERDGYTFIGWNTASDGSGNSYFDKENVINLVTDEKIILYAQWKANTYTIKFDANTGIGTVDPQVFTYDVSQNINANTFNKTGYTFVEWNTKADGTGTSYENQEEIINLLTSGSITLYARWTANSYKVQFNSNTGTGTMEYQTFIYDVKQNLSTNKFEKTGYTFAGWNTASDGTGIDYNNNEIVSNLVSNGTITLYAQWKANTYRIEFDANTGIGTMEPQWFVYDRSDLLDTNGFTKNGYTFAGWNTKADGTGTNYANGDEVSNLAASGTVTLYAKWTANTYEIEFNANLGTGSIETQTFTYDEAQNLSSNTFTRIGYTFAGWNTKTDGSGTSYSNQEEVINLATTGTITLYAIWTANTYEIEYNSNLGTGTMPIQLTKYDLLTTLHINTFERVGYTFVGWNTKADGTGTNYNNQAVVSNLATTGTITLYAIWTANTYEIEYNSNLGTGTMPIHLTKYDLLTTLHINTFERVGYTFVGWNTKADGTGTNYNNQAVVSNLATSETVTLYAQWIANTYEIEYNSNLGTGSIETQTFTYDETQNLSSNTFTRVGYTFSGWNTLQDGSGTSYANGEAVSNLATSGTVTLYAQWKANTYRVEFNANLGTGSIETQTFTYDKAQNLSSNTFTRVGYTFIGWNTKADGTGTNYNNQAIVSNLVTSGTVTLYAMWDINTYTIEYHLNGGSITNENPTSYTVEDEIELSIPERLGYTFIGWEGTGINNNGKILKGTTENIVANAVWKVNNYNVIFNANGGIGTNITQTFIYDVPQNLLSNTFTKTGYTFSGWNTKIDGTGTNYDNQSNVNKLVKNGNITLYAMWTPNTYTVEFNANGGTGIMSNQTHTYDKTLALSENTFTKVGYTFDGWNTLSDGSGNSYENQEEVSNLATSGKTKLYAMWTANTYEIEYNSNLGTGTMPIQLTKYDLETILYENTFERVGYTFAGWNTKIDGTGTSYANGEAVSNLVTTGTVTLYAKWTPISYIITYDLNGGTVTTTNPTSYTIENEIILNTPTKRGYTFTGWTGTNVSIDGKIEKGTTGNITATANWQVNIYTIEYNLDGGTVTTTNPTSYTIDDEIILNAPTKQGYVFTGWTGTNVSTDGKISKGTIGNITVTANYELDRFKITFDANGGSNVDDFVTYYGYPITKPNNPNKVGHEFVGWYIDNKFTTEFDFTQTMPYNDLTLYAKWDANESIIGFISNGGTAVESIIQDYGTTVDAPTAPTKKGYTFVGWYSDIDLTSPYIFTTMPLDGIVLYAKWDANRYDIIYDANLGTGTMPTQMTAYDVQTTLYENEFERVGYTFNGWNTKNDGTGTSYANGAIVSNLATSGTVTLYAKWIPTVYTIEYNLDGGTVTTANPTSYTILNEIILNEPTKKGYTFTGWTGTNVSIDGKIDIGTTGNITVTALYIPNTYTVEFNANGGTGIISNQTFTYDEAQSLSSNTLTKVGYTFTGWNTKTDGSGTSYRNQEEVINLATIGTITLYAQWTANTYTVEFNANSGTGSVPTQVHTYDGTKVLNVNTFTKVGYTFDGWNTAKDGSGTSYANQENVSNLATNGTITLYAQWTPNTYTVEFNANSNNVTGTMSNQIHTYDGTKVLSANTFAKEGYTFAGWNTTSDGSGTSYANQESVSNLATNGTITLYAQWTPNTYTVEFNSNGGTGTMFNQTHTYDGTKVLSTNAFAKVGYTFARWNTAEDGSGTSYSEQESVINLATNGTITLYAQWTANTYTVEFNSNGGLGSMSNQTHIYDKTLALSTNAFTRVGYTFAGWNTAQDGSGTSYENGAVASNLATSGTITLYAQWTPNTYTVEFNSNGGLGSMASQIYTYDRTLALSENEFTRVGYTFAGWNTASNGTGTSYANQESVSNLAQTGTVTLYAKWTPNKYTVEFNSNGGLGSMSNQMHIYDDTKVLSENTFTKVGYTFAGWNTASNGSGTTYDNQESVSNLTTTGTITLYAKWTSNTYTVEFNSNGGTGTMSNQTHTYDRTLALSANTFTRVGYTFAGWNTAQDGSGTSYANNATVSNLAASGTVTLYAKWTANTYTVEFNPNGGTGTMSNQTHTYDKTLTLSANAFTRVGYTFAGWNTKVDGSGTSYSEQESVINLATNGTITLYAKWTANTYTVEFNSNSNNVTGTMGIQSFTYGVSQNLSENVFEKTGYTFVGWNTEQNGSGIDYSDEELVRNLIPNGKITLYAKWRANTYTVIFNPNGGSGSNYTQQFTYNELQTLNPNQFNKSNYTFNGWNSASDGSGTSYAEGASVSNLITSGTVTLYAQWRANTYTVEFNANGGTGSMNDQMFTYDVSQKLNANTFTKVGYTFAGWNTEQDGSGTNYSNLASVNNISNGGPVTLYAKWNANHYNIEYNANLGIGTMPIQMTAYDKLTTLYENTFERAGYTFSGWNTKVDGTGTSYANGATVSNLATSGTVTLYAKWNPISYTITYNLDGGTVTTTNPTSYTIDDEIILNAPTKKGYTFTGWTGTNVSTAGKIEKGTTGNITVTATYTPNTYKVEFNANGGTGTITNQTFTYDISQNLSSNTFTRVGYTFSGWNTAKDGSGTSYANGAAVSNLITTGTVTLYAKWTPIKYSISYTLNGGTVTGNPTSYTIEDEITLKEPTKKDYKLIKWIINGNDSNGVIHKGTTGNLSIEAVYGIVPKIESLSFDVYKDENGTEPYYSDGQNNSIYVGNGSFYMKLPRDAFIDIYSIGFTTNTSIYLNPESKDIEGDSFFDISATKGGKGSKNGTIDFNIELGLAVDIPTIDVAATNSDATKWRSTKQTKYLQGVKFFFQVLSSNNLAFAEGLAKSNDDISSPRYISYRQDVQNNTFIFFAPVGTTRTSITYVKDNINLATINYIPIGSAMPDMGEYQLPGYKFEGWYLDPEFTKPYDTSAKVEKSIKVYGKYKELDIDNSWYEPAKTSYDVCGKAQLKALASIANTDATFIGKTINLTCNTDLGNEEWIPITGVRTDSNGVKYFEGTFNGNGYKIKNLKITTSPNTELGFFGATRNSTIKNVIFDGVTINSTTSSATAAAVGYAYNSHAYQVLVKNATISGQTQTAGIFGRFTNGSIKESAVFDSNITSSDTDTGSAGASLSGTITIQDFYSNAIIKSNASAAPDTGGIIGSYTNSTNSLTMQNLLFTGTYSSSAWFYNTSGEIYGRIGASDIKGGNYDSYSGSMNKDTWLFDSTIIPGGWFHTPKGTGKSTTNLKKISTYSESVWSRDIWVIDGVNYPKLKWITLNPNIDA